MHQGVNLKLSFVEGVLRRGDHIAIDNVTNPRIQTHLKLQRNCLKKVRIIRIIMIRFENPN